ncbi:MAG: signal transduction histidine kinase [Moritella dasanensis]|jgi:signal transduction histidine kinase
MNYKFNLGSYVCICLFVTVMIMGAFTRYGLNEFKRNHDKKVSTLMALNEENYLQHKLIINAMRSFFKSSDRVKEADFEIFTRELLDDRTALFFTMTRELTLGYISDDAFVADLDKLEVSLNKEGILSGDLPHYQLILIAIDEPNMPYLFYAIPLDNLLFNINKLKGTCLKYTSVQLSTTNQDCARRTANRMSAFFRYSTDLDISVPEYKFYYILGIESQVSSSKLFEFSCILLSILIACVLISILLYFKLINKYLFINIERENKFNVAMVSSINHEIRTPINALLGYSQILKDMPKISDEHSAVIDKMLWSANLLYSVAENTLNYSKSTAGGLMLNSAPINTLQYMDSIKDYYNRLSIPADKILDFNVSDKLPAVISVDSTKLFQIITNMINNALKYSTGKTVRCHIDICQRLAFHEDVPSGPQQSPSSATSSLAASQNSRGYYLRILIQDSGLGMSQSTKQLLTNPFTVDAESQLKQVSSIGLGLYTCNQLLTQVGGKLRLHSVKNEGTKIMLHFPCQFDQAVPSQQLNSQQLNSTDYASIRVLIVDDNSFNLEVCNAMLEDKQFNTVCANCSKDGLVKFVKEEPNVVIVDYQLDVFNGLELITKMKFMQSNAQIQYFILSANDKNEIVDSEHYPDVYFMQKPFNTAIFLSCLASGVASQKA